MNGLHIDIVKILLLPNNLIVSKDVFETSQGGTFKLVNPKYEQRTDRQSGVEFRKIYFHLDFFLWLLLIAFIHVKERKMKN